MSMEPKVSRAFMSYAQNADEHHGIWMETVQKLGSACKLDEKTAELSYIIGIQEIADRNIDGIMDCLEGWLGGNELEKRAVAAAL